MQSVKLHPHFLTKYIWYLIFYKISNVKLFFGPKPAFGPNYPTCWTHPVCRLLGNLISVMGVLYWQEKQLGRAYTGEKNSI